MAIEYRQPQDVPRGTETALGFIRHISWGAVFAGIFVAIASQITLTLLGLGIGLAAVNPGQQQSPTAMAVGAGLWWLITGLISLFLGGYVAARMSGSVRRSEGALHGLATWAAAAVFSVLLMTTSIAGLVGGSANMVGQYLGQQQAQGKTVDQTMQEARQQLSELTGHPAQPATPTEPARPEDVKAAKDTAARAALWAFFAMLLGCGAAIGGRVTGAPQRSYARGQVSAEEERRRAA